MVAATVTVDAVGCRHTREEILDGALLAAIDDGLSQLTFGRFAKRLGISDRIVVYYFPTKLDLVNEVVVAMGLRLQLTLAEAFATPAGNHLEMVVRAWPLVATPDTDRIFALFFEANGLAAIGREPYASVVPALVEGWIDSRDRGRDHRRAPAPATPCRTRRGEPGRCHHWCNTQPLSQSRRSSRAACTAAWRLVTASLR